MARINTAGFELNSATNNMELGTSGSPTISSTTFRSGAYAGRISSLSSGTLKSFSMPFAASGSGGDGPYWARTYFRYATLPSAENRIMSFRDTNAGADKAYITIDNTGVLALYNGSAVQIGSDSSALSANTWYGIEMRIDRSPAAGSEVIEARLWVDGGTPSVFATSSAQTIATNAGDTFRVGGNLGAEAQTTGDWFFDDIAVNNSTGSSQNGYPGIGHVIHLRPSAAGDAANFSRGGADSGANWSQANEVTPNDSTNNLTDNVANETDDYNIDDTPSHLNSASVINVVHVGVRFNTTDSTSTDPGIVLRIKDDTGGTVQESAEIVCSTTTWNTHAVANPRIPSLTLYDLPGASTTAWTKAKLDTAQIGVRVSTGDTHNAQFTAIWLCVDYTPGVASSIKKLSSITQANLKKISGITNANTKKVSSIANA